MTQRSYSGRFRPSYPGKYKGDPTNIIYRSLWERKLMVWCDKNENVLEWGSEEIIIPYVSPIDNTESTDISQTSTSKEKLPLVLLNI